jgi:hypothetical protein
MNSAGAGDGLHRGDPDVPQTEGDLPVAVQFGEGAASQRDLSQPGRQKPERAGAGPHRANRHVNGVPLHPARCHVQIEAADRLAVRWNDLSSQRVVRPGRRAASVAVEAADATVDHADIRASAPPHGDPSRVAGTSLFRVQDDEVTIAVG